MISILLVDDHKIMRDGLKSLIEAQNDLNVVAEADDGRGAIDLAERIKPDVVIMDVVMPDLNGVEATRQIIDGHNGVKVIGLSMHSDARFVARMLKAGARGYLLKDCAFDELVQAIRAVLAGQIYLSPQITGVVIEDYISQIGDQSESLTGVLTARQREVLQLLAEGHATRDIAARLHISVKTVETHRQHIMDKLGVRSVAALTKLAIREGLTSLDS